jgi:hypothetical protein
MHCVLFEFGRLLLAAHAHAANRLHDLACNGLGVFLQAIADDIKPVQVRIEMGPVRVARLPLSFDFHAALSSAGRRYPLGVDRASRRGASVPEMPPRPTLGHPRIRTPTEDRLGTADSFERDRYLAHE